MLDDARTPEDTCLRLKAMYLTLDPVRLLRDMWTTRWTGPDVVARDFVDGNASPLLRRDKVEKSGTAISNQIGAATLRVKPWVWRSASP